MRLLLAVCLLSFLAITVACTSNPSPDEIRQKTERETATLKNDTKAVAEGVKDGLAGKKLVDLNRATKDELASLPGITSQQANRIVEERPYADAHQLVTRQILSEDEYLRIRDRVEVSH